MKEKLDTFACVHGHKKFQAKLMGTERLNNAKIQMYCKITELFQCHRKASHYFQDYQPLQSFNNIWSNTSGAHGWDVIKPLR